MRMHSVEHHLYSDQSVCGTYGLVFFCAGNPLKPWKVNPDVLTSRGVFDYDAYVAACRKQVCRPFRIRKNAGFYGPRSLCDMKEIRRMFLFAVMALLLCLTCSMASGETLIILGRAEDAAAFAKSQTIPKDAGVLVLEKSSDRAKSTAASALREAGLNAVSFMDFPSVAESAVSEKTLAKKWGTESRIAQMASRLRRQETDCVIYYSDQPVIHSFLSAYLQDCAQAAWNPDIRIKTQKEDEYILQVREIRDGKTGAVTEPVYTDWKDGYLLKYGAKKDPFAGLQGIDPEGFLPEGECVLRDEEDGVWAYVSGQLSIGIAKYETGNLTWFEADIRRKPGADYLHMVSSANGKAKQPDVLARENHLVLGINADYYQYRLNYNKLSGLIVRAGKIVRDFHQSTSGTLLPPLDTLMLSEDGMFRVDSAGAVDGERALTLGAKDVLSFGPILVRNGRIRLLRTKNRSKLEPRTAVGLIEPNHYLAIVVVGRMKSSRGISLDDLRKLMYLRGCTEAINLDGGHTSTLLFMGERLNKIGSFTGKGTSAPRNMSELLGIGVSSLVEEVQ